MCEVMADPALEIVPFASRIGIRQSVAGALRDIAGENVVLETVIGLLRHPEATVRLDALWCIQGFVPVSSRILSAVRQSLQDRDVRVAGEAASVLMYFGKQEPDQEILAAVVAAAKRCTEDEDDPRFAFRAFHTLKRSAPGSEADVLPAMVVFLDRLTGPSRLELIDFLGRAGPVAAVTIPKLVELSTSFDPAVAAHAVSALRKINREADEKAVGEIAGHVQP